MLGTQNRWQEDLFVAGPLSSLIPDDHILKPGRLDKVVSISVWQSPTRVDCLSGVAQRAKTGTHAG